MLPSLKASSGFITSHTSEPALIRGQNRYLDIKSTMVQVVSVVVWRR